MNYGKRLMLNLMIPDPAAWHRLAATFTPTDGGLALPVDPADNGISSPNDITEVNYTQLAGRYNAQVKQVPDLYMSVSRPYSYATSEVYDNVLNTYGVKATKPTETLTSKDDAIAIVDGYILDR
jgi:hypothetical protein